MFWEWRVTVGDGVDGFGVAHGGHEGNGVEEIGERKGEDFQVSCSHE